MYRSANNLLQRDVTLRPVPLPRAGTGLSLKDDRSLVARVSLTTHQSGPVHPIRTGIMRVLFLTHRLPYAPNRGDRARAHHLLLFLRTFAEVELVSLVHDPEETRHVKDLQGFATVRAVTVTKLAIEPQRFPC